MLAALGLLASLSLAAVFAAAGIAKLADHSGTRTAVREFGAPRWLVGPLARVLPLAELAVAVLVLPASTRSLGVGGALVLLVVFSAAIATSLVRGRTPDCHCFGQLHSSPASWRTLMRNGILAGFGVLAVTGGIAGETPSVAWVAGLAGAEIAVLALGGATAVIAVLGTLAFVSLMRSYGGALLRLEAIERRLTDAGIELEEEDVPPELGHEPGTPAPAFAGVDVSGKSVSLDDLLSPELPLLLLFTSPTCGPCDALLPDIAAWQAEHADRLTVAIADGGDRDASLAKAQEHDLERVIVDHELVIHEAYDAGGTPSAVLVAPDGTISSYVAPGAEWIERLLESVLTAGADGEEQGLPVGSPAPDLSLSTLEGGAVSFAATAEESLVLFWNPECGFCSSMRDDLLAWERHPPVGSPRLIVVSSGNETATRAEGFSSTVVLDPGFDAGTAFGAGGTPMAVLLDSGGRVASPPAAGAEAVFTLAGGRGRVDSPRLDHERERVAP
ncbi:MAG: redoxin domain-containing protein [Gaiellaceae bacterium MAG52_C11]|nr:redoxin domain-containing protein [Candidatus Gaiellasilicea maunaloa]